jgi:hypothetical protein
MNVAPLPTKGGIHFDGRGGDRSLRVDAHPGVVTISLWRDDKCVGTHRLASDEVPEVIELLARSLRASLQPPAAAAG